SPDAASSLESNCVHRQVSWRLHFAPTTKLLHQVCSPGHSRIVLESSCSPVRADLLVRPTNIEHRTGRSRRSALPVMLQKSISTLLPVERAYPHVSLHTATARQRRHS